MKHTTVLLVSLCALLLSACVAAPGGAADTVITPKPPDPTQPPAPTSAASQPTAGPAGSAAMTPIVSTAVAASTVDLRTLKTSTPEPLPITSADVTIGQANYGGTVKLEVGQTLALVLQKRGWLAPVFDPKVLRALPWPGNPPAGMEAWLFRATTAGSTLLTLQTPDLPCEPGAPCSHRPIFLYEVTVVVAP